MVYIFTTNICLNPKRNQKKIRLSRAVWGVNEQTDDKTSLAISLWCKVINTNGALFIGPGWVARI